MKRKHNDGVVAPSIARGTLRAPVSQDGRQGLTVTEVLVCISVLGLLLTLVLPAVQRARETSRRTECVNNLKQLGVAVHNLEGVTNSFPHPDGHLISLLPHLGQNTLHEQLKGYENRGVSLSKLTGDVRLFQCPSDGERRSGEFQTNYFLNGGTAISVFEADGMVKSPTGSYYRAVKPVRAQEVRDGLSNTALYCERLGIPRGTFRSETELTAFARNSPVRFLWSTDEDYLQSESAVLAADCQFPENRVAVGTYSDPGRTFTDTVPFTITPPTQTQWVVFAISTILESRGLRLWGMQQSLLPVIMTALSIYCWPTVLCETCRRTSPLIRGGHSEPEVMQIALVCIERRPRLPCCGSLFRCQFLKRN